MSYCLLFAHNDNKNTIQVYSVTVMTHVPGGGGGGVLDSKMIIHLQQSEIYGSKRHIQGKYRGQNATFWENIGVKFYIQKTYMGQNSTCRKYRGRNSTLREHIGVKTLH